MTTTYAKERLINRVTPRIGVRLIPEPRYQALLGNPERLYVCIGDYDEVRGYPISDILGKLFEGVHQQDEQRLVEVFGRRINTSIGICKEHDYTLMKTYDRFYIALIDLSDAGNLDLFPGTWKSIAYIVSDPGRMARRNEIYDKFMRTVQGKSLFRGLQKSEIDFYELGNLEDELASVNSQNKYYCYLASDSAFADEIFELFGIYNRCWHGRGYTGSDGTVASRVFLIKNIPVMEKSVISCKLMNRHDLLD